MALDNLGLRSAKGRSAYSQVLGIRVSTGVQHTKVLGIGLISKSVLTLVNYCVSCQTDLHLNQIREQGLTSPRFIYRSDRHDDSTGFVCSKALESSAPRGRESSHLNGKRMELVGLRLNDQSSSICDYPNSSPKPTSVTRALNN